MAGSLQLFADGTKIVPGFGKFTGASFGEPGFAVGNEASAGAPWHSDPPAIHGADDVADVVVAALCLAQVIDHIADIDATAGV